MVDYIPSFIMITIVPRRISLSPVSFEEINTEKHIENVHTGHSKQGEWKLDSFTELGSVLNELDRNENMSSSPRYKKRNPIEKPFRLHKNALLISNSGHSSHFPHVKKYRMQLTNESENKVVDCDVSI